MGVEDEKPYLVEASEGRFYVRDRAGRTVLVCGDEPSAVHYVVLLNEAYGRGYKAGYRESRPRPGKG